MGAAGSREFPYDVGEAVEAYKPYSGVWTLHTGVSQADQTPVSIFRCSASGDAAKMAQAKNAIKSLRRLRHPSVVKYIFSLENEEECCLVTEPVSSIFEALDEMRRSPAWLAWGLRQLVAALEFLHSSPTAALVHGRLEPSAVFVTAGGEWKLGGLELLGEAGAQHPLATTSGGPSSLLPKAYLPAECGGRGWKGPTPALDLYQLGCLCYELFNGPGSLPSRQLTGGDVQKIPRQLVAKYRALLAGNAKARGSAKQFARCAYFQNDLTLSCAFLAEFALKEKAEKEAFFAKLEPQLDGFPRMVCKKKILPELVAALDNGSANSRALGPILKIGTYLTDEEYAELAGRVTAWFGAPDFNLRVNLLQNIGNFAVHLTPAMVSEGVFPKVVPGFAHESAALRELTVKAMVHLAPKLTPALMTTQLLKCMAKLQLDPVPGIRTNTTICLAKVAEHIPASERSKTLIAAFVRAMHDPFAPARVAGVQSLAATQKHYGKNDIALKIMPTLCKRAIDEEKDVRNHALACIKSFVKKLEYISEHGEEQAAEQQSRVFGWVSSLTSFYSGSPAGAAAGGSPAAAAAEKQSGSGSSATAMSGAGAGAAEKWKAEEEDEEEFQDFEDPEDDEDLEDDEEEESSAVYGSKGYSRPAPSRLPARKVGARRAAKPMSLSGSRAAAKERKEEKATPTKIDRGAWAWDDDDTAATGTATANATATATPQGERETETEFEEFESFETPARDSRAAVPTPLSSSAFGEWDEEEEKDPAKATSSLAFDNDGDGDDGWGDFDVGEEEETTERETARGRQTEPEGDRASPPTKDWGWDDDGEEETTAAADGGGWGDDFDDFDADADADADAGAGAGPGAVPAPQKESSAPAAGGWGGDGGDFDDWSADDNDGDDGWGTAADDEEEDWGFTVQPSPPARLHGRASRRLASKDD